MECVSHRAVTPGGSSNPNSSTPTLRVGLGVHLPALDGLRGLAVLLVMIFHQLVMQPMNAVDRAAASIAHAGRCGALRAAIGADPVYELMGVDGLTTKRLDEFDPHAEIAMWIRAGTHGVVKEDWPACLRFLDAHFKT